MEDLILNFSTTEICIKYNSRTSIDIWVELVCIGLYQRWLLQLCIVIEIPKAYPVIQSDGGECEHDSEGPEIQLE